MMDVPSSDPVAERMNSPQQPHEIRLRGLGRGVRLVLAVMAVVLAASASAAAQVAPEQAQKVADQAIGRLRSPFCPGLMLEVCPSPNAEALRDSIRTAAAQGQSSRQIVEGVLARYGEEWRAVPKRSGAGLLAWLILPFSLVAGGLFLWGRVRAMRAQGQVYAAAAGQGVTDEERARLEQALREFEHAGDEA
jgi:cytochrome c-type biogenesis protein CcmH/NrfF